MGGRVARQFLAHVSLLWPKGWMDKDATWYVGRTWPWPLDMEVNLGPGDIVLDGNPVPLTRAKHVPLFGPCLLWSNGWMDQDDTWYADRLRPRPHCIRWGLSSPRKRAQQPPPLGQTVAHLSHCRALVHVVDQQMRRTHSHSPIAIAEQLSFLLNPVCTILPVIKQVVKPV